MPNTGFVFFIMQLKDVPISVANGPVQSDLKPKSNWTGRLGPLSQTDGVVNIGPIDFPSVPSTWPSTPSIPPKDGQSVFRSWTVLPGLWESYF